MFKSIAETSKATGLSQHFLYNGCRNGTIPCIKSGKKYLLIPEQVLEVLRPQVNSSETQNKAV